MSHRLPLYTYYLPTELPCPYPIGELYPTVLTFSSVLSSHHGLQRLLHLKKTVGSCLPVGDPGSIQAIPRSIYRSLLCGSFQHEAVS